MYRLQVYSLPMSEKQLPVHLAVVLGLLDWVWQFLGLNESFIALRCLVDAMLKASAVCICNIIIKANCLKVQCFAAGVRFLTIHSLLSYSLCLSFSLTLSLSYLFIYF